ncbi:phosphosulfolactate synthase [Cyanobium sp. ATX 6A2]|uniref:phosphosulfolactate synthase n=1 Tax=Cyanobium sp. ATX 6A2 TaxID=2823700 RepID=UPI0020CC0324|nr:phosphosulfolactate synthase [Cyanobium sp. ATX 6A2]MCP9888748.1 phosphosulfolactate synthase [Cyanobium sp. ATX 6A2]
MLPIDLPQRAGKPRLKGLTSLLDPGVPDGHFRDVIESHGPCIDHVKFGWGSSLITKDLPRKFEILEANQVYGFFGGTLFEKAVASLRVDAFRQWCRAFGCRLVEISTDSIQLEPHDRARYISSFAHEFSVLSEVGSKRPAAGGDPPAEWIRQIRADLDAGASYVILESRESGTSGLYHPNGELRRNLLDAIIDSDLPIDRLIFEAPAKDQQALLIHALGPSVNLANIRFTDSLALESLRLGLRADTFGIYSS